ncbi:MAG TPA: adenylate/guanylate cyclase domain-containing protein, partial [Gammaproteobacteria bacterium]|nr:adenylate/guanylate cyclase domain-containing protein [Gammaproteobacteria bacterium]
LDRVKVKGKHEPVTIYEPVGLSDSVPGELAKEVLASDTALNHYFAGDLEKAYSAFQILQDAAPERRLFGLYLERIAALQSQGIGPDWDGVFEHTSK